MQPSIAWQIGVASGYISARFAAASQISSLPFLADFSLMPRFAVEMPLQLDWISCRDQLADPGISSAAIRRRSKRVSQKSKFQCGVVAKCRTVIGRHAGLPCTLTTVTLSVSHAWGNPMLTLRSAGLTALKSFSLASLHSRIAFFSESHSAPRTLLFSSSQGPVRKNSGAEDSSGQ